MQRLLFTIVDVIIESKPIKSLFISNNNARESHNAVELIDIPCEPSSVNCEPVNFSSINSN